MKAELTISLLLTRLNDFKAQESFYKLIIDRYMQLCARSDGEQLDKLFAQVSRNLVITPKPTPAPARPANNNISSSKRDPTDREPNAELSLILAAMRKLREAIVATHRRDSFAQRAYIFIIHSSLLVRHFESYHPALLYLLNTIHAQTPLPETEHREFLGYHILDLACRQRDLTAAYTVKVNHAYSDRRVDAVLKALATDNWYRFWRMKRVVDGRQAKLLEWAEEDMRLHVLKCLGRSHMHADREFVERSTGAKWEDLVKNNGCGWEWNEEKDVIVIRKPKVKAGG